MCRNKAKIHDKSVPDLNKKRCLKNKCHEIKNKSKKWSQIGLKTTIEKWAKNDTKELPDCEKDIQKSSLFGAKPPSHGG